MITIKELSESIGISKVGITKWIERNGYKDRLQKIGNKYVVPADVEQVIRANFAHREPKKAEPINPAPNSNNDVTSEIIALLREQLEAKDREIDRLHTQVENLQAINADMVKAVRELNTLQAMQLTDGTESEQRKRTPSEPRETTANSESIARERTASEQRENTARSGREAVERTTSEQHVPAGDELVVKSRKRSFFGWLLNK